MTTRREVLGIGSVVFACMWVGANGVEWPTAGRTIRTIFDNRFVEARTFAVAMQARGALAQGFRGDVTRFWQEVLRAEWARGSVPLAGMTSPGTLFCLERWAWDAGMRVVFRVDHQRMRDGSVNHHAASAVDLPAVQSVIREMGDDYPRYMANLLIADKYPQACCASASGVGAPPHRLDPLVTWVIAPLFRT